MQSEPESFCILLEILMRSHVLLNNTVANWLFVEDTLKVMHRNILIKKCSELVTDISVDLVFEAFDTLTKRSIEVEAFQKSMDINNGDDGAADTGSKRSRDESSENIESPEDLATRLESEARLMLSQDVQSCRATYRIALTGLFRACASAADRNRANFDEFIVIDPEFSCLFSQLKRTLRMYHESELELVRDCPESGKSTLTWTGLQDIVRDSGNIPPEVETYVRQFV